MKKISVIVPIYNVDKYLKKCIDSIIKQTYQNLEILLIDDGSTDQSLTICNEYLEKDERVKVIHKKNEGVSIARNKGIKASSGSYVTFVDSDDWLESNAIETMVTMLEAQSVECVRMSYFENFADGRQVKKLLNTLAPGKYEHDKASSLIYNFIVGNEQCYAWLFLVKKELLNTIGGYNPRIYMMEDTVFYIKLLSHVKSIFLSNIPTYHYYQNMHGVTKSPTHYTKNVDSILKVNMDLKNILNEVGLLNKTLIMEMDTTHVKYIANYFVRMHREGSSITDIHTLFDKLHNDEHFMRLASNLLPKKVSIHVRYTINTITNNQFELMLVILRLRRVMKLVKSIIPWSVK